MKTFAKNAIVLALTAAASIPAFAFLLSPVPVAEAAPSERTGTTTVEHARPFSTVTIDEPVIKIFNAKPRAQKTAAPVQVAPAEDPWTAARSRLHDPQPSFRLAPLVSQRSCAPDCGKKRPVAFHFDAPGSLPAVR